MEVFSMNCLTNVAASGLTLMLTLAAPAAWCQPAPANEAMSCVKGIGPAGWSKSDSVSVMDQNVSRDIKQAWSEGKNATAAMAFQENGEIAMGEGKQKEARQYFQAAENELGTLEPEHDSH
jgi:hypothetical protein